MEFVARPTWYLQLPLAEDSRLENVESVLVKFGHGLSVDMGAWCYLRRSSQPRKKGKGTLVDLSSFDADRAAQVSMMLRLLSQRQQRANSSHGRFIRFSRFIFWCDTSGHVHVLSDVKLAHVALRDYVAFLRRLVDQHQIGNNSAVFIQFHIVMVLVEYFGTDEVSLGINLLTEIPELKNPTQVPGDDDQSMALAWAQCIFDGFSHLAVDRGIDGELIQLPMYLKVPGPAAEADGGLWVFPTNHWNSAKRFDQKVCSAYDFVNGTIRTVDAMRQRFPGESRRIRESVYEASRVLQAANEDHHHWFRLQQGVLAMSAFYLLFMAAVGQNESQVLEIPWSDELQQSLHASTTLRQGFRQIKYRAGNRVVSFEVGLRFIPQLRRYLQLREFVLMGNRCDLLFFRYCGVERNYGSAPISPAKEPLKRFYRSLKSIAPDLPIVHTRQWRAAKDNYVIRITKDPALSAEIAQHSLSTALRSYNNGNEVTHQQEMGNFLIEMEKTVITIGAARLMTQPRGLGQCTSPGEPSAMIPEVPIPVDCGRAEGCLFCDKFRVHADEADVRKLLSARHCIRITGQYCRSVEEHERVMGPILKRIEFVLAQVRAANKELIAKMEIEVDVKGELDEFWSAKLETLIALGMELL